MIGAKAWALVGRVVLRRKRKRDAFMAFWRTEDGKVVLADLYVFCAMAHPILDTGDMNTTVSRLGARSVFLRIKKLAALTDEEIEAAAAAQAQKEIE
jgi:hypothetical protein